MALQLYEIWYLDPGEIISISPGFPVFQLLQILTG